MVNHIEFGGVQVAVGSNQSPPRQAEKNSGSGAEPNEVFAVTTEVAGQSQQRGVDRKEELIGRMPAIGNSVGRGDVVQVHRKIVFPILFTVLCRVDLEQIVVLRIHLDSVVGYQLPVKLAQRS